MIYIKLNFQITVKSMKNKCIIIYNKIKKQIININIYKYKL